MPGLSGAHLGILIHHHRSLRPSAGMQPRLDHPLLIPSPVSQGLHSMARFSLVPTEPLSLLESENVFTGRASEFCYILS